MLDEKFTLNSAKWVRLGLICLLLLAINDVLGQTTSPVEVEQAFTEVSPLTVMITAGKGEGDPERGTGIIVGYDNSNVYVITADHVVWSSDIPSNNVRLDIKYSNGDDAPIRNVEVLPNHESRHVNGRLGLDLAVLRFDRAAYKMPLDELNFNVLGRSNELKDRERMYTIGYADNGTKWNMNPLSEQFSSISGFSILYGTTAITAGYSGGPIFNSKFQLVGMVTDDTPPNGKATAIEAIIDKLKEWRTIPNRLAPGPGRIIIGELDRSAYLLGDAVASVSIFLPSDSPQIKPFVDKTVTDVMTFANQNPAYDNERPRELYYAAYTPQGGRHVPDQVTIYTDSSYWPAYDQYPLVTLATRIQTTSLHFYHSPIDPKNFNPDHPAADLTITFGMNWVKYTSTERQTQAEQNGGRLELELSLRNRALEQFGWNMRAPKRRWNNPGNIISLLDLRGAQVIISTVVGNLGNRDDLRAAYNYIRAQTQLNYLNLSLGDRAISFNNENTRRFLDRNGDPYYVFVFPKTSQELLKVFQPNYN
jgi:V8-like Glu-specific endopeptidase